MIAYRPAAPGDEAALAALCLATQLSPWSEEAFRTQIAKNASLPTAWDGDRCVGFAVLDAEGDLGYLYLIATDEAYRRQGIASALLAETETWCRAHDLSRLLLEVRVTNLDAQDFYQSHQFKTIARRPSFYTHPREDGFTMEKELS